MHAQLSPTEPALAPPKARRYDLMLFDLDGTLVETAPEIGDAVNDCLQELGHAAVSLTHVRNWIGHGIRELMVQAMSFVTGESAAQMRESAALTHALLHFEEHYARRIGSTSSLYPQVRQTLQRLREQGVRLAVVTNKNARFTRATLDAHRLTPFFEVVVSGDSLPVKKPDPAGVNTCLEVFGVARERTLFVGDSSIDVATARAAGIAVWAVPYGYNQGQPIEQAAPDRVIADFSALL